ncbi:hypothetical protein RRG08_048274 [Elysia crispata]|uniref:Secreted protein n=1 Tax=Elysia crispata TaxID=231223 RepID=A0AAE1DLK2_9GAST|nr:hypothetical protein RRG08_048274 [Elysia crispata]
MSLHSPILALVALFPESCFFSLINEAIKQDERCAGQNDNSRSIASVVKESRSQANQGKIGFHRGRIEGVKTRKFAHERWSGIEGRR